MIEALITLRGADPGTVGRDRIRLLETVGRAGSITAGARAAGLSYKAAWDALDGMARLFGRPLLATRTGGPAGGGARLTPAGAHVIAVFARLEAEVSRVSGLFDTEHVLDVAPLRTSARNVFRGTVRAVRPRRLTADIALALPDGVPLIARVTEASLQRLDLAIGRPAIALVKAPFVRLAPVDSPRRAPSRNRFSTCVQSATLSGGAAEVLLDIGSGRTLTASLSARRARSLDLSTGRPLLALIDPADIILAVE